MKRTIIILFLLATLTGCGGGGTDVVCHEVRYIHLDNSYEYITVCDDRDTIERYIRNGVTEEELFPSGNKNATSLGDGSLRYNQDKGI